MLIHTFHLDPSDAYNPARRALYGGLGVSANASSGSAPATGAGTAAAAARTTLASDDPAVVALQTMDDWDENDRCKVNPISTEGGCSAYSALSSAAVISAQIKGSAGQLYGLQGFNIGANEVFVRIYNQTGAPANTDTANIIWRGVIPGNADGAGFSIPLPGPIACATGIGIRVTAGIADNDNTSLNASEVMINAQYK